MRERGIQTSIFYPVDPPLQRISRAFPRCLSADHRAGVANRDDASVLSAHDPRGPGPDRHRTGRGGRAVSDWRVPLTDIAMPEHDVEAVLDCLRSGWLTMGPRTKAFEEALAGYVGTPHAAAVSSGTAALHLACQAAGLGPGDEVIVPAITFVASASACRYFGAEPVLFDVRGAHDFNVDPEDVARRITSRTRAVIAMHFCGYPADVAALRALCDEHGLRTDRGLRPGDRRTRGRRRTAGRHRRRAGLLQLLLQEAAVRGRGWHGQRPRTRRSTQACGCFAPMR